MITTRSLAGWAVLMVVLVAMADIPATEELGVAFAYVFLLAVLMGYGPAAFAKLSSIMGSGAGPSSSLSGAGPSSQAGAKPV